MMYRDRLRASVLCAALLALCLGGGCLVAQNQTAQKQQRIEPLPSVAPPAKSERELAKEAAQASFDTFTVAWMRKRAKVEEVQQKVTKTKAGFTAEYATSLPTRYIKVKTTKSKETPFVGTLSYYQKTFRCTGKTKKQALKGPYKEEETNSVSEIFRYTKGEWVY